MADNILEIGAMVDVSALQSGMSNAASAVASGTSQMSQDFEKVATSTGDSLNQMRADLIVMEETYKNIVAVAKQTAAELAAANRLADVNPASAANADILANRLRVASDAAQQMKGAVDQMRAAIVSAEAATMQDAAAQEADAAATSANAASKRNIVESLNAMRGAGQGAAFAAASLVQQSSLLSFAFEKAFPVLAAFSFLEILMQIVESIVKGTEALVGWDDAARKAFDNLIASNNVLYQSSLRNIEAQLHFTEIGQTGLSKLNASYIANQQAIQVYAQQLRNASQEVQRLQSTIDSLTVSKNPSAFLESGIVRSEKLEEANASLKRAQENVDNLTQSILRLQQEQQRIPLLQGAQRIADQLAEESAQIAASRTSGEARIALQEQFSRELLSLGQVTQSQETAALVDAENQRYELLRNSIARRRQLALTEQSETGKSAGPDLASLKGEQEALELSHQAKLSAITTQGSLALQKIQDAAALATVQSAQRNAEARVTLEQDTARRMLAERQISIADETALLSSAETKAADAKRASLEQQLRIAQEYPERNKAEIIRIQGEIEAAETEHQARLAAIAAEGAQKQLEETRRRMQAELTAIESSSNRELSAYEQSDNLRLKLNLETLGQWESNERDAINRWYDEQHSVLTRQLNDARQTFGENSVEYQKLVDREIALEQQKEQRLQQIDNERLSRVVGVYNQITQTVNRSIAGVITGQTTLLRATQAVFNQILETAISAILRIGERWLLEHVLMAAASKLFHIQDVAANQAANAAKSAQNVAQATSEAAVAAGGQFAYYSAVFPPIAPAMAAAAYAQGLTWAGLAAFEKGGISENGGLSMLHPKEMVLPERLSTGVQKAIDNGGLGASTPAQGGKDSSVASAEQHTHVHIHQGDVTALDAKGVSGVLAANNRAIAKEVRRALRSGALPLKGNI